MGEHAVGIQSVADEQGVGKGILRLDGLVGEGVGDDGAGLGRLGRLADARQQRMGGPRRLQQLARLLPHAVKALRTKVEFPADEDDGERGAALLVAAQRLLQLREAPVARQRRDVDEDQHGLRLEARRVGPVLLEGAAVIAVGRANSTIQPGAAADSADTHSSVSSSPNRRSLLVIVGVISRR